VDDPVGGLLREAAGLPEGPVRLALLEEAARAADACGDVATGFRIRSPELMWSAINAGQPEKLLVAFAWCLARSDRDPQRFPAENLLWEYSRWVLDVLCSFPQFPRRQIAEALDDMETRFRGAGRSLRVVAKQRCLCAAFLGDLDAADAGWHDWQRLPFDPEWDDAADECCDAVRYLLERDRDEAALALAAPIRDGRLRSDVVPHNVFGCLLLPLSERGLVAEAMRCHRRGVRLVSDSQNFLGMLGYHMEFLAAIGDADGAVRLFERHLPLALRTTDPLRTFFFHQSCRFSLSTLARERPR
jgi:hypothetical protein